MVVELERYLEGNGQQPLENLVSTIAEEAMGVDMVVLTVEPQMDLTVWVFRWTDYLKGDLC